jgi:phosphatidylinositol alpha-1,6-mannosyltransferase
VSHILVTNDFPPKRGGIQSYLYDLWNELDPDSFEVVTIAHPGDRDFDAKQNFVVHRLDEKMLLPTPKIRKAIEKVVLDKDASLVILDPALPVGLLGPQLGIPYGVILHGAEITVPARLPGVKVLLKKVLQEASFVLSAGHYALREVKSAFGYERSDAVVILPGIDINRFLLPEGMNKEKARQLLGLSNTPFTIASISRLVPRKGMDVLIEAVAALAGEGRDIFLVIAGKGRDESRLKQLADAKRAPVEFLGEVSEEKLKLLLGASDIFAMLCRNRWFGLEQEGYGIVFNEAAAAGLTSIAGRSGGSHEAVLDSKTGLILDRPGDVAVAKQAIVTLMDDDKLRLAFAEAARHRAETELNTKILASKLADAIKKIEQDT